MLAGNKELIDRITEVLENSHDDETQKNIAALKQQYLIYDVMANDNEMQVKGGDLWRRQMRKMQEEVVKLLKFLQEIARREHPELLALFDELDLDDYE